MSTITITDENGTRSVDMEPVERWQEALRERIRRREFFKRDENWAKNLRGMSQEQLVHLASILTSMTEEYAHLYASSFSSQHHKVVEELREIKKAAERTGVELWPEWPELGDE